MIRTVSILFSAIILFAAAETKPPSQTHLPPQYNFLFVVDTSGSMATQKVLAANLVRWGIYSGFNGQALEGDSIDIWTFDDENHITRYPPQIWGSDDGEQLALSAGRFVEGLKFRGRNRFAPVATDLNLLMPHTKGLLVMIVTDGDEPISGVSVDIDINEHIAREKKARANSRDPYLISFAVVNGTVTEWMVHHGDEELQLATLPARPKPAPVITKTEPAPKPKAEPPLVIDFPAGARIAGIYPYTIEREAAEESAISSVETPLNLAKNAPAPGLPSENPNAARSSAVSQKKTTSVPSETAKLPERSAPAVEVAGKTSAAPQQISSAVTQRVLHPLPAKIAATNPTSVNPQAKPAPDAKNNVLAAAVSSTNSSPPLIATTASQAETSPPEGRTPGNNATKATRESAPWNPGSPLILASAFYIALLAGFASVALSVLTLLRKAKARHTGSIISRSLQQ